MNKQKLFTLTLQHQENNWFKTLHVRIVTKGSKPSTIRFILLLMFHYRHIPKYSNFNITINCSNYNNHPVPSFDKSSLN